MTNVDYLAIVVAAARPKLSPGLIDRYLIVAMRLGIAPIIVVNKLDLVDPVELIHRSACDDPHGRVGCVETHRCRLSERYDLSHL